LSARAATLQADLEAARAQQAQVGGELDAARATQAQAIAAEQERYEECRGDCSKTPANNARRPKQRSDASRVS